MPWKRFFRRRKLSSEIQPDEIFMDSSNLPSFDTDQFEGRIERPISKRSLWFFFATFAVIALVLLSRAWVLDIVRGTAYAALSEENRLSNQYIFADRGTIKDRLGKELAYDSHEEGKDFPHRVYAEIRGLGQVLGYAKAPTKDSSGFYYQERYVGVEGLEKTFDTQL
jgi:cell division protein FtsI/penicillin-binding protein 2